MSPYHLTELYKQKRDMNIISVCEFVCVCATKKWTKTRVRVDHLPSGGNLQVGRQKELIVGGSLRINTRDV